MLHHGHFHPVERHAESWLCYGCDTPRDEAGVQFCPSCEEPTESYQMGDAQPFDWGGFFLTLRPAMLDPIPAGFRAGEWRRSLDETCPLCRSAGQGRGAFHQHYCGWCETGFGETLA